MELPPRSMGAQLAPPDGFVFSMTTAARIERGKSGTSTCHVVFFVVSSISLGFRFAALCSRDVYTTYIMVLMSLLDCCVLLHCKVTRIYTSTVCVISLANQRCTSVVCLFFWLETMLLIW
jgi:hypothetical protein